MTQNASRGIKQIEDQIEEVQELLDNSTLEAFEKDPPAAKFSTVSAAAQLPTPHGPLPRSQDDHDNQLKMGTLLQEQSKALISENSAPQSAELHPVMQSISSDEDQYRSKTIADLKQTVNLTPDHDPKKATLLNTLGNTLYERFNHNGDILDLVDAVTNLQQAVNHTSDNNNVKLEHLNDLAKTLNRRFGIFGWLGDIDKAIAAMQQAVNIIPNGHADKAGCLNNLGISLLARFERVGDQNDIDKAIATQQEAVDITPEGYAGKANHLTNLGNSLSSRFERFNQVVDIDKAITVQQKALNLTPKGHAEEATRLTKLGNSFLFRFQRLGELCDIKNAIAAQHQAVNLTPDGHPEKASHLNNLANCFLYRFDHLGDLVDLNKAVAVHQEVVNITTSDNPARAQRLTNLGNSFLHQFKQCGDLSNINKAIAAYQDAVDLTHNDHAQKAGYLNNLGNAFRCLFERLDDIVYIEKAIAAQQQAVNVTPHDHADKAMYLNNLGISICCQFYRLGKLTDIDKTIATHQEAVSLVPDDHPDKAEYLSNLGISFRDRFHHIGELNDINKAISAQEKAVNLTPDGHLEKARRLSYLGTSFRYRFERLGDLSDIDKAIATQQEGVNLTPEGFADKAGRLSNLGASFYTRAQRLGELSDIEMAIATNQEAVNLIPDGHAAKAKYLTNLGNSHIYRFRQFGEVHDINSAISAYQEAVDITPDDHAQKAGYLSNLGNCFITCFDKLGGFPNIEKAITLQQQAVNLTPDGNAGKAARLTNLGISFVYRFQQLGEVFDIDKAIDILQQAVNLTPDGHFNKAIHLIDLGLSFRNRFGRLHEPESLASAITAYSEAVKNYESPPLTRYNAALDWASLASVNGHTSSALDAYSVLLEIIPQRAWLGQKVARRYEELSSIGSIINAAVATAISMGHLTLALEWLEEGRSIVWGQINTLRTPIADLMHKDPSLAEKLQKAANALENAGISTTQPSMQNIDSQVPHMTAEQEAQTHRALAAEYNLLIKKIRSLEGFKNFLQPKKVADLIHASKNGPVVAINVHESRCDALIIHSYNTSGPIIHVPLPAFSDKQAMMLLSQLNSILKAPNINSTRKLVIAEIDNQTPGEIFQSILSNLWSWVVQPILLKIKDIAISLGDSLLHITWCATGPLAFLPLHAAGNYGTEGGVKIFDYIVSSYTPTLSSLLIPPPRHMEALPKILVVSQPNTPGEHPLSGTIMEVKAIMKHNTKNTLHLSSEQATVSKVLQEMSQNEWVHLACHGIQNIKHPLKSAFALYDGKLELEALMKTTFKDAQLAFLSACETATGDENLPEEAIHLAAGMLTAGFPSVIATMWSIGDKDAPIVAEAFYSNLLRSKRNCGQKDSQLRAAYALHEAVKELREKVGEKSFIKWVPFVHFGL
ncbi:hypothetical protein M422DRAFT_249861 [Sphaerobolus stellatus SS14]|uniref:CHAT domain-containing protein n=1 Tax=Sphaerobolus stellatus (strain SS14) TaxID=990650 RepID=A0A0C9W3Q1_SPHS4|nr:hypothetical protein M422DRAFT_249861 [Sphaerobolus stellatus SS14]